MLENVQKLLDEFKSDVIREAKKNLSKHSSSGKLKNSLRGYVKESKNSIQISFEMEEYGFYQDKGVRGVDGKIRNTPYRYTQRGGRGSLKGMPPPKAFDKWAVRKGIAPRDKEGKFLSRKSLQFMLARSVFMKGIKPTLFFTKPFEKYYKNLPKELEEKYGLDMINLFDTITAENFKRLAK